MKDSLEQMFATQVQLMKALGVDLDAQRLAAGDGFSLEVINAVLGINSEAGEVADELTTASKPWKQKDYAGMVADLVEESVDVLFFLMELWLLLEMTPSDVLGVYRAKVDKLYDRIRKADQK